MHIAELLTHRKWPWDRSFNPPKFRNSS